MTSSGTTRSNRLRLFWSLAAILALTLYVSGGYFVTVWGIFDPGVSERGHPEALSAYFVIPYALLAIAAAILLLSSRQRLGLWLAAAWSAIYLLISCSLPLLVLIGLVAISYVEELMTHPPDMPTPHARAVVWAAFQIVLHATLLYAAVWPSVVVRAEEGPA